MAFAPVPALLYFEDLVHAEIETWNRIFQFYVYLLRFSSLHWRRICWKLSMQRFLACENILTGDRTVHPQRRWVIMPLSSHRWNRFRLKWSVTNSRIAAVHQRHHSTLAAQMMGWEPTEQKRIKFVINQSWQKVSVIKMEVLEVPASMILFFQEAFIAKNEKKNREQCLF